MSGIAGIYHLDGRLVGNQDVQRMVDSIVHRGADGSGVWTDGPIGLGHQMLWTTPESLHEKLPLTNKTGDFTITADARIDNRDELIFALHLNGCPCETITDSELILTAYEKWGERCSEKLLGDFAFAIWDSRNQRLFCARDHMGVKPFYYYHSDKVFVFASEIKALLSLTEVPRHLNEVRVADYLVFMDEDKTITFYKDILRLPPAHSMTVNCKKSHFYQYWSLDPSRELKLSSDEEYAEAFREIFSESVRFRLRSAFPVGSMLSGGLDSSSIVCMARQLLPQNGGGQLHTFSAIFDDVPECDERPYINAVLAQGNLRPHYVHADQISPFANLDSLFYLLEEPLENPHQCWYQYLYQVAQKRGTRILLDGTGGDFTVEYGFAFLNELARSGRWKQLFKEVRDVSKYLNLSPYRMLWHRGIKPVIPEPIRKIWRILRRGNRHPWRSKTIINSDFAKDMNLAERLKALGGNRSNIIHSSRGSHWLEVTSGVIPYILEMANKGSAAFSIEGRYPFFDKRLVEFCLGLPPEQKLYQGWTRMIMRRAFNNILPAEVQWRGWKTYPGLNFTCGLLKLEKGCLEEVVFNHPNVIKKYIDVKAMRKVYHRFVSRGVEDDAFEVWRTTILNRWLHHTGLIN